MVAAIGLLLALALPALADDHAGPVAGALKAGADRLTAIQNPDGGFPWTVPGSTAPNTIGASAQGLLGAYHRTEDPAYLAAAKKAGDLLVAKYNAAPTQRPYSQDVEFLVQLAKETDDATYRTVAQSWFANTVQTYPTGALFVNRYITGRGNQRLR